MTGAVTRDSAQRRPIASISRVRVITYRTSPPCLPPTGSRRASPARESIGVPANITVSVNHGHQIAERARRRNVARVGRIQAEQHPPCGFASADLPDPDHTHSPVTPTLRAERGTSCSKSAEMALRLPARSIRPTGPHSTAPRSSTTAPNRQPRTTLVDSPHRERQTRILGEPRTSMGNHNRPSIKAHALSTGFAFQFATQAHHFAFTAVAVHSASLAGDERESTTLAFLRRRSDRR